MTYEYPDFENAVPDNHELRTFREGYSEWKFREAVQDIIRATGNRLVARGIALKMVREETEKPNGL